VKKTERAFCSGFFFFFLTAIEIKLRGFNGKILHFSGKKEKMEGGGWGGGES